MSCLSNRLLILASQSTGRAAILRQAGFDFVQIVSGIEEPERASSESVQAYVMRVAVLKANTVAKLHPNDLVLAADTVLEMEGAIFGKPSSLAEAESMLGKLQGRRHLLASGLAVAVSNQPKIEVACDVAQVTLKSMTPGEIKEYIARTRPLRFAGAYALQGDGADLVERVDGREDTVIGLPMDKVLDLLSRGGITPVPD